MALATACASAGTFSNNFNSLTKNPDDPNVFLPPAGTFWGGSMAGGIAAGYDFTTGGVGGTGVIKLVNAIGSQQSTFVIENLDEGKPFVGFDIAFQLLLGNGSNADGFAFFVGDFAGSADSPITWGEEGPGIGAIKGVTVSIDIYNNGGTVAEAPAVDIKVDGTVIGHRLGTPAIGALPVNLQSGTAFWPVKLHADPDGTVDLVINNVVVYTNLPIFKPSINGENPMRVGFSARTGGSSVNAWIDDLTITTTPIDAVGTAQGQPFIADLAPVRPIDVNASALSGVQITVQDSTFSVNTNTIKFLYNNAAVTAPVTITRVKSDATLENPDRTLVSYFGVGGLLPTGAGTATLSYYTTGTPAVSNIFSFSFTVGAYSTLNTNYIVQGVDREKPGFKARVHLIDTHRAPGDMNLIINAERQLADGYRDSTTHAPYENFANLLPGVDSGLPEVDADGWFVLPDYINFDFSSENGNFRSTSVIPRPDSLFPGIPGVKADGSAFVHGAGATENFAIEFVSFIELKAGGYRFGFNSDDGFRASFGFGQDAAGTPIVGSFNGGRGAADSLFDVVVPVAGVYPLRISYWQGGGGANAELFIVDPSTNEKILINDAEDLRAPRAYREASGSRPSIAHTLPVQNDLAAFPNDNLEIVLRDGGIALDDSSIVVKINNAVQTVTKTRTGKKLKVVRESSLTNLLPSGLNTVNVIYGFTEGGNPVLLTNVYAYSVAPYYNALQSGAKISRSLINEADTGFNARYNQIDRTRNANQGEGGRITGNGDGNRMPNPEIQLINGEINLYTGTPFENIAMPGASLDFTAVVDVVNFNNGLVNGAPGNNNSGMFNSTTPALNLPGQDPEKPSPGLAGVGDPLGRGTSNGSYDNYVMELTTYLDLKAGIYVFGFNSDDGFVAMSGPDPRDTLGSRLGFADFGRGNSGNLVGVTGNDPPVIQPGVNQGSTVFSVVVPEDGIFPIRVLYWQGGGGVNSEFYTLNKDNRSVVLVNDTDALDASGTTPTHMVPAYRTYTGPARPWARFSVSPTPWDNRQQQSGPGPLTMLGRTANSVQSGDIYNWADINGGTVGNSAHWADIGIGGIIANGAPNGVADATIRLRLNGADVAATTTVVGTSDLKVVYQPKPALAPGTTHTAALVYGGTTNSWTFKVQNYQTLKVEDKAIDPADPTARGFSMKIAQATAGQANTAARVEAQLAGTPVNVAIPSAAADGRYILPGIVNFNNNNNNNPVNGGLQVGNFQRNTYGAAWPFPEFIDEPIPGLPGTGTGTAAARWENFTAEIFAYLDFPAAGYYRLGGNVDDGMVVKIGKPGVTTGTVLFTQDRGGGAADIPFSVNVPVAGLYPVRFLWYQGGGGGQAEFFSYDQNGVKIPINDSINPNAIKAYYKLADQPKLTAVQDGDSIKITWTNGGELQSTTSLAAPIVWTGTGDSDGAFSEALSTGDSAKFYRVKR